MSEFVPEVFGPWTLREAAPGRWSLYEGDREVWVSIDKKNLSAFVANSFVCGPPIAAIERLLALRRAALAPEAQAPSGEPWRPAVGERCFYYHRGEWRLVARVEDDLQCQRFKDINDGQRLKHCLPDFDGIRPLGSLPVPPSCGGEPEVRERVEPPAVASERPGLARLLGWARGGEREANTTARELREELPGNVPHHEGRRDAYADCAREIEREIAALGPPSIAEDLRTPEPGAFAGAQLIGADGHEVSLRSALAKEIEVLLGQWDNDDLTEEASENDWTLAEFLGDGLAVRIEPAAIQREVRNAAVREALAELRGELSAIGRQWDALRALDRLAERFR